MVLKLCSTGLLSFNVWINLVNINYDATKQALKAQGKKQRRGTACICFGNSARLMDAARFIKEAWDAISTTNVRNAFQKVDLKIVLKSSPPLMMLTFNKSSTVLRMSMFR